MEKLSSELRQRCLDLEENLKIVQTGIEKAADRFGRAAGEITLLGATKTVPVPVINHGIRLGIRCIGENRVQELCEKYDALLREEADVQFIGHLQTNKVRQLVGKVCMIQSVDSNKLAAEISKLSLVHGSVMDVLVEVNIGNEASKSGVLSQRLPELLEEISEFSGIRVRGLMAIPPSQATSAQTMTFFSKMYQYFVDIKAKKIDNVSMDFLSMGMSSDYAQAIEAGANMVRVGSALFGKRLYSEG